MNEEKKVLACVDPSVFAQVVGDYAAWAARRMAAPLEFLHVIDGRSVDNAGSDRSGAIGVDAQEHLLAELARQEAVRARGQREAGRLLLDGLRRQALGQGVAVVDVRQRHGELPETLAQQQGAARLVVLGRRGASHEARPQGLGRHFEWVVRSLETPVLAVGDRYAEPTRALLAYDGSAVARRGVEMIAGSALLRGLPLHVVMAAAARGGAASSQVDTAVRQLADAGFAATGEVVPGDPVQVIDRAMKAHGADLLVMGAYTHSPLRSLFGRGHTNALLGAISVPTLLLR